MSGDELSSDDLDVMQARADAATAGPWEAFVEGRDHLAGDDFIRTGGLDGASPDMYISQYLGATSVKVSAADLDFIAQSRQDVPRLIDAVRPQALKRIGLWRSPEQPDYPDPHDFVHPGIDDDTRHTLVTALEQGARVRFFMGFSQCRICGAQNGSAELTDGVHLWPEGLAHYVRDHGVVLPSAIVDSIVRRFEKLESSEPSTDWWIQETAEPTNSNPVWRWLRDCDDSTCLEAPRGFDRDGEIDRAFALVSRLSADVGTAAETDIGTSLVQDASFLGDITIPGRAASTGERIVLRLSNFGRLVVVALEGFGIHDEQELDVLLDDADSDRIVRALRDHGYRQVPERILWSLYDGTSDALRAAYPTHPATWWIRYFDYL